MKSTGRTYLRWLLLTALLLAAVPTKAQSVPDGFSVVTLSNNLQGDAVGFSILPDGRVLVIYHQLGYVRLLVDKTLKLEPLLTVPRLVKTAEQGLLGIAVDPDFPEANYIYLFHTQDDSTNRVTRFTVGGDLSDPNSDNLTIDAASGDTLLVLPDDTRFHSGGTLRFGQDKTLYVSHGDDVQLNDIQSLATPYGKILRINRDGSVPDDNPVFPDEPDDKRGDIYAIGLRNPFRFNIDPVTGTLLIGDVGTNLFQEINLSTGGENFGYPKHEGHGFFRDTMSLIAPEPTFPVYDYPQTPSSRSVIALATYRPRDFPNDNSFPADYDGVHFFADFYDDELRYLRPDGNGGWTKEVFGTGFSTLVDAAIGLDGSLYVLTFKGGLRKIVYGSGFVDAASEAGLLPFSLEQNFPNPVSRETAITYTLSHPTPVKLEVFDVLGRSVAVLADGWQSEGAHTVPFDASFLSSGVYFYRLQSGEHHATKTMVLGPR